MSSGQKFGQPQPMASPASTATRPPSSFGVQLGAVQRPLGSAPGAAPIQPAHPQVRVAVPPATPAASSAAAAPTPGGAVMSPQAPKGTKYRPPDANALTKGLEIAGWARFATVASTTWVLVVTGVIAILQFNSFPGQGVYTILYALLLWGADNVSQRTAVDKSLEAVLYDNMWSRRTVKVYNFLLQNYVVRGVWMVLLAAYTMTASPTIIGGICACMCSLLYFIAFYRGEKGRPITGLASTR